MSYEIDSEKVIAFIMIAFFIFFVFGISKLISNSFNGGNYCEGIFGEEWYYKLNQCGDFDECVRECRLAIINETTGEVDIESKYFVRSQWDKYCKSPGFWNLNEWSHTCSQSSKGAKK